MAPTAVNPAEKILVDVAKTAWETEKTVIVEGITALEGGAEGFVVGAIKNAKASNPFAESIIALSKGSVEAYVQAQFTTYGPNYIYTFVDAMLTHEAAVLGG